ncbi:MAG: hypothetical protein LLG03_12010 [Planctomycetaceae bacterium]|nr:hypothetical protein [Planctomycetaceae bacterium]
MAISQQDRQQLRELTRQYQQVACLDVHGRTMQDWRRLNGLRPVRPMVMIDQICWHEMNVNDELTTRCEDPFVRGLEWGMRASLYKWKHFPADMAFYPFLQIPKVYSISPIGVDTQVSSDDALHSGAQSHLFKDQLADDAALAKLKNVIVRFDAKATAECENLVNDLVGDIMPVKMSGMSIWAAVWDRIVFWRGATPVLYDLADRPEFLHRLMRRLMEIEMDTLDQLEQQSLLEPEPGVIHCVGAYSDELPAAGFDPAHVRAKDCWAAGAAQIFSEVSPAMHDEFEIAYLKPYLERFGLINYGCCEPLHRKIDIIRKIRNVRMISVSPWAQVEVAAESMGRDFVMARKNNPSFVAMDAFDERLVVDEVKATLKATAANGTPCAFILKDITTVRNEPQRLTRWYQAVKATIENC